MVWLKVKRTDYLELPLLVHFEDPRSKFGIGIGITWSRLVYIKEMQHDFRRFVASDSTFNIKGARRIDQDQDPGRYKKNDWGIILDLKIPIYKGLKFNFRFQYSIAPFGKARQFYNSTSHNFEGSGIERPASCWQTPHSPIASRAM